MTLGPNVVVNQALGETSGYADLGSAGGNNTGDGIVNEGTINAQAVNGSFYIEPNDFTNQGIINVSNGDTLDLEPTISTNNGTITLATGTTLTLGSSNTSALSNSRRNFGDRRYRQHLLVWELLEYRHVQHHQFHGQSLRQLHDGAAGAVR